MFLIDYFGLVKHGKILYSTCCKILWDFGGIFKRAQCCVQASKSGPVRTHRGRRPPSSMIVTAMIVTVSPQCTCYWISDNDAEVFRRYDDGYIVRSMTTRDAAIVQDWYVGMGNIARHDLDVSLKVRSSVVTSNFKSFSRGPQQTRHSWPLQANCEVFFYKYINVAESVVLCIAYTI